MARHRSRDRASRGAGGCVILYRWRGASANFGDELNTILWPRLLPGFFDSDPDVRFLGIGSVLDERHPSGTVKLVAGSGYGGYERKPLLDENWIIHWVRGPRSAAMLGLPPERALGDPAVLLPPALGLTPTGGGDTGFMPHFESAARGAWQQAAEQAGVRLIDPRGDPLAILHAIGRCKLLLSEALHGVIVADALRVPWIALRPLARIHRAKWQDWAETMHLHPRFQSLSASTLREWAANSKLGYWHATRRWLDKQDDRLHRLTLEHLVVRAGDALRRAMAVDPQLSADSTLQSCQSRMLEAVHALAANPLRSVRLSAATAPRCLHVSTDSAYQLKAIG
jgi:succinoglycan biosynthesis protein ExoV